MPSALDRPDVRPVDLHGPGINQVVPDLGLDPLMPSTFEAMQPPSLSLLFAEAAGGQAEETVDHETCAATLLDADNRWGTRPEEDLRWKVPSR